MRQDNRGITLIEMIIAIAVSVIVIGAATLFIRNALQSFKVATDTIDLQIEAQVLMEQLATWAMEGNEYALLGKEKGYANDVFIIYHKPRPFSEDPAISTALAGYSGSLTGETWMRVIWCDGNGNLYMYMPEDAASVKGIPTEDVKPDDIVDKWNKQKNLISDYVESFVIEDIKLVKRDSTILSAKVPVLLTMKAGIHTYELRDNINMRNAYTSEQNSSTEMQEP